MTSRLGPRSLIEQLKLIAETGLAAIDARQFLQGPEPDYIGRAPHELPY